MPIYTNMSALLAYVTSQITSNGNQEITGAVHREVLQTVAQSLHAMTSAVPGAEVMDFDPWDAGTTYTGGQEVVVRHDDKLWLFISDFDSVGAEPGTDGLVWQEMSALHLAHMKDRDKFLSQGTPNEVSAAELREHLDAVSTAPALKDVLGTGNVTGLADIEVQQTVRCWPKKLEVLSNGDLLVAPDQIAHIQVSVLVGVTAVNLRAPNIYEGQGVSRAIIRMTAVPSVTLEAGEWLLVDGLVVPTEVPVNHYLLLQVLVFPWSKPLILSADLVDVTQ